MEQGNPADAPQLARAIERVTARTGRPPRAVTADRGYGEAGVGADLHALGVDKVAIPRKEPGTQPPVPQHTTTPRHGGAARPNYFFRSK